MLRPRNGLWVALCLMLALLAGRLVTVPAPYAQAQDLPLAGPEDLDLPGGNTPSGSPTPQPNPSDSQPGNQPGQEQPNSSALSPRDQLRQLFERRLELMNDADINGEIQALKHNVAELEAQQKLKEIQKSLSDLVEHFPQTQAANAAQMMLQQSTVRFHDPNDPFAPHPGPVFRPANPGESGFGTAPGQAIPADGFQSRPTTIPRSGASGSKKPQFEPLDAPLFQPGAPTSKPANATSLAPVSTFPAGDVFNEDSF